MQPHDVAEQVGKARPGRARPALDVDQPVGEGEVIAHLEVEPRRRAHGAHDLAVVLGHAVGGGCVRQVRELDQRRIQVCACGLEPRLDPVQALAQLLGRGDLARGVATGLARGPDLLGGAIALGAQAVGVDLHRPPGGVEGKDPVDLVGEPSTGEAGAHQVRLAADQRQVEHGLMLTERGAWLGGAWLGAAVPGSVSTSFWRRLRGPY